jgi:hypothetical protein
MTSRVFTTIALLLALVSCGTRDPTGADGPTPTLLVVNPTCVPGPCQSIQVRGAISLPGLNVPGQPANGAIFLGRMDSSSACLRLPPAWTLTVIGADTVRLPPAWTLTVIGAHTVKKGTWTYHDPITVVAAYSAISADLGRTTEFVPAASPGWIIRFADRSQWSQPVPSDPCTP